MKDKYDVIIIGAGIGGLVCGSYLVKAGLKVLIVEKNKKAGGCAGSVEVDGFTFDIGAHVIGGCESNGLFRYYSKKMELDTDFIRLNPSDRFVFGRETISVPENFSKYISMLMGQFPREKDGINRLFEEMAQIYKSYIFNRKSLQKYAPITYQRFLNVHIKNKKLQGILSALCPYVGLPPARASVIAHSFVMISYLRDGYYLVKGGIQNLANSICKKITENSGDILYSTKATKILLKRKTVKGVIVNTGDFIKGKIVVSNIDANKTYLEMIDHKKLKKSFIQRIRQMKRSTSCIQLHLGLDIKSEKLANIMGWHYESYNINRCFKKAFYIFVPTKYDKTLSPENKSIIQIKAFPGAIMERNTKNIKKKDVEKYLKGKISKLSDVNIDNKIITSIVSTPKDLENFTGNSKGAAGGWEMSPRHILNGRLQNVTPIDNLFLTGHWTIPGSGILGVATSGMVTAREILKRFF